MENRQPLISAAKAKAILEKINPEANVNNSSGVTQATSATSPVICSSTLGGGAHEQIRRGIDRDILLGADHRVHGHWQRSRRFGTVGDWFRAHGDDFRRRARFRRALQSGGDAGCVAAREVRRQGCGSLYDFSDHWGSAGGFRGQVLEERFGGYSAATCNGTRAACRISFYIRAGLRSAERRYRQGYVRQFLLWAGDR